MGSACSICLLNKFVLENETLRRYFYKDTLQTKNFEDVKEEIGQVISSKGECLKYVLLSSPPTLSFLFSFWFNCSRWFQFTIRLKPSHVRLMESLSSLQPLVHWSKSVSVGWHYATLSAKHGLAALQPTIKAIKSHNLKFSCKHPSPLCSILLPKAYFRGLCQHPL